MASRKTPTRSGLPGDPDLFSVLTEIHMIAHLSTTAFERALVGELTMAQFGVLNHLLRLGDVEAISDLASAFQVTQPTMSSTVKRLLEKNYVEIIPDKNDRRVKYVSISAKGRRIREQAVNKVAPHMALIDRDAPGADWADTLKALHRLRMFFDERR